MGFIGQPYTIQKNDTLWDIAATKLGNAEEWPKLLAFNNQPEVLSAGARRIEDPDLIYAGAEMRLPIFPNFAIPTGRPSSIPAGGLKCMIPEKTLPLQFAFELKGNVITADFGTFIARISIAGRVVVYSNKRAPLVKLTNLNSTELSGNLRKEEARNTLAKLVTDHQVKFDPVTKAVTYSNKMIVSSEQTGLKAAIGVEMKSTKGVPVLVAEFASRDFKGKINGQTFAALGIKIKIEIEPKLPPPHGVPVRVPVRSPVRSPARAPQINWDAIARGAKIVAVVIVAAIVVALVVTFVLPAIAGAIASMSAGTATLGALSAAAALVLVGAKQTTIPAT